MERWWQTLQTVTGSASTCIEHGEDGGQALVTGNAVVVKISEHATLAAALTVKKIAEALPLGVLTVLAADGAQIGDPVTGHRLVRRVNFPVRSPSATG